MKIHNIVISDLFSEMLRCNVELRTLNNLWDLCDEIKTTTFNWSMCRMGNAMPRE